MNIQNVLEQDLFRDINPRIKRNFTRYYAQNPHIYDEFKKLAQEMRMTGRKRYGAKAIVEAVRWNRDIATSGDDAFKISNSYVSLLPRLLVTEDASFDGFFQLNRSPRAV